MKTLNRRGGLMGSKQDYERFLWFDREVRKQRYPNATSLSRQFSISRKTAQRNIEFMRDRLGAPLKYDSRLKGYYYEDRNFFLPSSYLTMEQITSLIIARSLLKGIVGSHLSRDIYGIVENINSLIRSGFPDTLPEDDPVSFRAVEYADTPPEIFRRVLEGCLKKKVIRFSYYSPAKDEHTRREVEPYHLLNYMGTWHLVGYCHLRDDLRDFVLVRMSDVEILERGFHIRKGADLRRYMESAFGIFKGEDTIDVKLRFTPEKAKWIREQVWHRDQEMHLLDDGSLELTVPVVSFYEIQMKILKHGADVEVLEPPELREIIKEEAGRILKIYDRKYS